MYPRGLVADHDPWTKAFTVNLVKAMSLLALKTKESWGEWLQQRQEAHTEDSEGK